VTMTSGAWPSRRLAARTAGTVIGAGRGSGMGILQIYRPAPRGLPAV
jgi:hypothetical protein